MPDALQHYLNLHNTMARTMLGVDCTAMGHGDYLYLDFVLFHHPHIVHAVELGTQYGLTAIYLGMAMRLRGGDLATFDITDQRTPAPKLAWLPNMDFFLEDVLTDNERVKSLVARENVALLVDNGNKERETELYARLLGKHGVIFIHDWGTEVNPNAVEPFLGGFTPFRHDIAETCCSHLRAWSVL